MPPRMRSLRLRAIPSVDKLLQALGEVDIPRPLVLDAVRRELATLRRVQSAPDMDVTMTRLRSAIADLRASRLQPLINGTGILVHTNFGRAPRGAEVVAAGCTKGAGYRQIE